MKMLHIPFLLVLFDLTTYVRDIYQLPLFGSRIYVLNIYLLIMGCLLYVFFRRRDIANSNIYHDVRYILNGNYIKLLFFATLFYAYINIILVINSNSSNYFNVSQLINLLIGLLYFSLIIIYDGIRSLLRSLGALLWLVVIFQLVILIIARVQVLYGEIGSSRNSLAYIALIYFILRVTYMPKGSKKYYFLALIYATLNKVSGVFILLFLTTIYYASQKIINKSKTLRVSIGPISIILIVLLSYFSIQIVALYFDVSLADINKMEEYRYHLPGWLGSLISRSISMPNTISEIIANGQLFGIGIDDASALKYWGYPVHNYFVSLIAISGVIGLIYSLVLLLLALKVSTLVPLLAIITVFYLSQSNDLSLLIVLCLTPLMLKEDRQNHLTIHHRI